jgi:fatty acid/phospholipid biosynthesis enzyme
MPPSASKTPRVAEPPLLSAKGCTIICHGRSNANAIKNAVRVAAEFAASNLNERLHQGLTAEKV